ncbi:DUF6984 family protein [Pseudomonas sp. Hp2]|uniref:DUF6984 family protein n=1 Tax=Pseudomonas sp. Hp2 TaxID=701189 RepID=UPI00355644D5
MRPLNNHERTLIWRVANRLPEAQRDQLCADLSNASVSSESEDRSRVSFDIAGYCRPAYSGQHPYPVEIRVLDVDNVELTLLLHADEQDRLLELELIRWEDGVIKGPRWDTLTLF